MNRAFFYLPQIHGKRSLTEEDQPGVRIWADDYSDLLPLIRAKELTKIR